ncbi:MAG: phenylalanine--tRNA ligase subunit beta [Candidatus Woesearchaeota archaeon]|nr:MAG: phenylalanine--tRNA ligase subunit beta [Candidatus Woesearchaeota archaeon]
MPTITLNKKYLLELIGEKVSDKTLADRIPMLGTDLKEINEKEITVEVFPNRPDMLSEEGFARALSSFLGIDLGLPVYEVKRSGLICKVEKQLKHWPYVVTAIVKGLKFNDEKIKGIIQLQEKLAVTHLRNRKKGGIGIYPLDKLEFPITFTSGKLEDIKFRPLEMDKELNGREILEQHPTGKKYSHVLGFEKEYPYFIDNKKQIMSMPPIINSHLTGRIDENTKDVFVEATGTDLNVLQQAINIICAAFADIGGEIYSMEILYKERLVSPNLRLWKMSLDAEYANKLLGLKLGAKEIKKFLQQMGMDYENGEALIPRYRVDILHPIDLVEEVAIAHGYEHFVPEIPNVSTIGEESNEEVFFRKISDILVGLGFNEVKTYCLTNENNLNKKMNFNSKFIELENSLNADYSVLRSWIIPSLIEVLSRNKHNEYPQNVFDVGRVFLEDNKEETGVKEFTRLGLVLCNNEANFTSVKQVLDALMLNLGLLYEIKEDSHESFIKGRVGRISIKGKKIAYIGEIHPSVLKNYEIETPAAALELNLTELFELIK